MAEAIKKEDLNRDGVVSKQEAKAFAAGQGETLGVVSKQDENLKTLDTKGTVDKADDTFAKVPGADAKDLNKDGVVSAEELAALAAAKADAKVEEANKTNAYVDGQKDVTDNVDVVVTPAKGKAVTVPVIESPEAIITNLQAKTPTERFEDGQAKIAEKAKHILDAETMDAQGRPEAIEAVKNYTEKGNSVFAKFPEVAVVSNKRSDFVF